MTSWFGIRICSSILAGVIIAPSAHGQGGSGADVSPPASSSQAVILEDLYGAKIHAKLVTEMLAQREGRQGPATQEIDWQLSVEPEGWIDFSFRATARTPRGIRAAPVRAAKVKLDEPWSTDKGEAVWQFKDGDLTFVRSFEGGAVRTIISFKRDGKNFTCAARSGWAREAGKKGMVLNSPIDGVPVTILSWKPGSSSCEVTR